MSGGVDSSVPAATPDVTAGAADAFISYSRTDREAALALADGLRGRGRTLWVDWEGIPPTAEWMSEIRRGIDRAQGVLFLLSPASVRSSVCRDEVAHAVTAGKRIVPVVVADVEPDDAPEELRRLNWVFARPTDDLATSLDQIEQGLDLDLEAVRTHTRLLVRSTEWRESGDDKGRLLRGAELDEAEHWLAADPADPAPTAEQRRFIQTSRSAATRRQRRLVVTVSLALVGSLLLAGLALVQRRDALAQRDVAATQALASRSLADVDSDPARALQEAVDAARTGTAPEVVEALRTAVLASHLDRTVALAPGNGRGFDVAWSTDGSVVYSSSVAQGLVGVDATTGAVVMRNPKATGLWSVSAMPDGRRLVVAGPGSPVTFVDRATGATTVAAAYAQGGSNSEVAVSRDGRYLVTTPFPFGASNVLDGADGHLLRTLAVPGGGMPPGPAPITADVSPDSTTAALGLSDGSVRLYDLATGAEKAVLHVGAAVTVVRWSPSGRLILTASQDRLLRIWDFATASLAQTIGQSALLADAAWLGSDEYVVTADGAARARVWSVRRGDDVSDLVGHTRGVNYVAVAPDGRHVATTADDGTLRTWDVGSGVPLADLIRTAAVTGVDVAPDDRMVVAASADGGTVAWDPATQRTRVLDASASGPPRLSPDGRRVAVIVVSDTDAGVRLLDLGTGRRLWQNDDLGTITVDAADDQGMEVVEPRRALAFSTAFSPDGSRLAVATQLGATVLDATTGRRVAAVEAMPFSSTSDQYAQFAQVRGIAWSPDGTTIAVISGRDVLLADPATGAVRRAVRGGSDVASVAFPLRSDEVLASYADGQVREWSTRDGSLVHSFPLTETALAVDVSPSGDVAATGRDGYLRIWTPDGVELQRTRVATIVAMSVRWTHDGQHLVVGTGEGLDDRVSFAEELGAHPSGTAQLLDCPVCASHDALLSTAEHRIPAKSSSLLPAAATPSTGSTTGAVPAALAGRWSGTQPAGETAPLAMPGLVGWDADGTFWYWSPTVAAQGRVARDGDELVLDDDQCPGSPGRYRYAVSAGALTFTAVTDTCEQRKILVSAGPWHRQT
ncbi:MAG: toll/interleukin-1 receptor domain-containing protein [Candidatus Nanopelagicales bacterium]